MFIKLMKTSGFETFKINLYIQLVAYAVGCLILWLVVTLSIGDDVTTFPIATLLAGIFPAFIGAFVGSSWFMQQFNYAVSMGCTRKAFIKAAIIIKLIQTSISVILIIPLYMLEKHLCMTVYSRYPMEADFDFLINPMLLILITFGITSLSLFIGAMVMRYGAKAGWTAYALLMIICIFPSRIVGDYTKGRDTFMAHIGAWCYNFFGSMRIETIIAAVIIIIMAMFVAGIAIFRRQRVTF